MKIDIEYLRKQYASMEDDALLSINRDDLTPAAQEVYDAEVRGRELHTGLEIEEQIEPDWMEDACEVCSFTETPGKHVAPEADQAGEVLKEAGIPCFVKVEEEGHFRFYKLFVPAKGNLLAMSMLDKQIFNAALEADFRDHFESLSDDEMREINPRALVAGLQDRIDRLMRVYEEELERRGVSN